MNPAAIHVYIDGSYAFDTQQAAYGWVVQDATGSMLSARVVATARGKDKYASSKMEAAAFIDALAEFAPRQQEIVIHGDCQALARLIDKWKNGEVSTEAFYDAHWLRPEDRQRLLPLLNTANFTFVWVKGHSDNFYNSVVDEMLRYVTVHGFAEATALAYARRALASGRAYVKTKRPQGNGEYATTYRWLSHSSQQKPVRVLQAA